MFSGGERSRAWDAILVAGIMVLVGLAGCANAPETADEGEQGSLEEEILDDETGLTGSKHGSVRGIVLHTSGFPLPDTRITILTVENSVVTKEDGVFHFPFVPFGEQLLRVEKETYATLQRPIKVVEGKITDVEVILVPKSGAEGGFSEHFHNHWGEALTYSVFSDVIEIPDDPVADPTRTCSTLVLYDRTCFYIPIPIDAGIIIPPGTNKITANVRMPDHTQFDQERYYFYMYGPADTEGKYHNYYGTVDSQNFTVEHEIPSDVVDHGHARTTSWQFSMYMYPLGHTYVPSGNLYNSLFRGDIEIDITAHKGELELDPPHKRYWEETDSLELETSDPSYAYCYHEAYSCLMRNPNPNMYSYGDYSYCYYACATLRGGNVVPPGTTHVEFAIEQYWGSSTGGEPGTLFDEPEWVFGIKRADKSTKSATWDDWEWLEPVDLTEGERGQVYHYAMPVTGMQSDPYYTQSTSWVVMAAVKGHEEANNWKDIDCPYTVCGMSYFEMLEFRAMNKDRDAMLEAGTA